MWRSIDGVCYCDECTALPPPSGTCLNPGCEGTARALGRCMACYRAFRRHGKDRDGFKAHRRRLAHTARMLDGELEAIALAGLVDAYLVKPMQPLAAQR